MTPSSPAARSTSSSAEFSGGTVNFHDAEFSGSRVLFDAVFSGSRSASTVPGSPAARSASVAPSSPAARSYLQAPVLRRHGRLHCRRVLRRRVLRRRGRLPLCQFSGGAVHFGLAKFSGGSGDFTTPVLRRNGLVRRRRVLRRYGRLHRAGLSPVGPSASATPSSPAARWTSPTPAIGHSHPYFHGQTRRPQA